MVHSPRREDTWKVFFVLLNLVALGLTAWALDSATSWGYALNGLELVFASLFAGSLVVIGVLGSLLYRAESEDDADKSAEQREGEATSEEDEDSSGAMNANEFGSSDSGDPQDDSPSQVAEPGQPLASDTGSPDTSGGSGAAADTSSEADRKQEHGSADGREVDSGDNKINQDLLTRDESDDADDAEQLDSDGDDDADEETDSLSEHTVRYRRNRSPY